MARIMIVDDSFVMRKKLKELLERFGHTIVVEAVDGIQAVKFYDSYMPDLVTMDINMPNVDGIATVKEICTRHPDAKIIMISSLAQKIMVIEAMKNGAKNYIIKPIEEDKLIRVIDNVLRMPKTAASIKRTESDKPLPSDEFSIKSENGTFIININSSFNENCIDTFRNAIGGLVFVKPLYIKLNLLTDITFYFQQFTQVLLLAAKAGGSIELTSSMNANTNLFRLDENNLIQLL